MRCLGRVYSTSLPQLLVDRLVLSPFLPVASAISRQPLFRKLHDSCSAELAMQLCSYHG